MGQYFKGNLLKSFPKVLFIIIVNLECSLCPIIGLEEGMNPTRSPYTLFSMAGKSIDLPKPSAAQLYLYGKPFSRLPQQSKKASHFAYIHMKVFFPKLNIYLSVDREGIFVFVCLCCSITKLDSA